MARNDPFTAGRADFAGNIVAPGMRTGGGGQLARANAPNQPMRTGGPLPSPFGPPAGQFGQGFGYGMTPPANPRAPIGLPPNPVTAQPPIPGIPVPHVGGALGAYSGQLASAYGVPRAMLRRPGY